MPLHLLVCILCLFAGAKANAEKLTMDQAVAEALRSNTGLQAARYEAEASLVQAERERPVARPTITVEGKVLAQGPEVTFPKGSVDATVLPTRYGQLSVTLEQPIYQAGFRAAQQRYVTSRQAAAQVVQTALNSVIRDTRKAYLDLLTAIAMEQVAREGEELAQKHLEITEHMVAAGLTAPKDVLTARSDLAEAQEGLIRAEDGVRLARANLNRVLGRPLDADVDIADLTTEPIVPADEAEAIAAARKHRPELTSLRLQIQGTSAAVKLAASQTLPVLSVRASAVQQTPSAFVRSTWYAVGLALQWPVSEGSKATLDRLEAEASVGRLRALLQEAEAGIELEVRSAWASMRSARARLELAEKRCDAAQSALDISLLRYEQRAATLLEVSAARVAVTRARAAVVQAKNDLLAAAFDLRYACGMDLKPEPPR